MWMMLASNIAVGFGLHRVWFYRRRGMLTEILGFVAGQYLGRDEV